jgi:hypothetical protein
MQFNAFLDAEFCNLGMVRRFVFIELTCHEQFHLFVAEIGFGESFQQQIEPFVAADESEK